jgi:cysteine synthase
MDAVDSLVDLVGGTPLVRLNRFSAGVGPTVLAKVEALNPGGSVKDRIGLAMIEAAEREGHLKPGGTIVEPTSGNTGVGLVMAALHRGYKCVFVMPDKMSQEKIDLLRAFGAEVVVCPTAVAPDDPRSYYRTADRLTADIPGAFQPNQYFNQANPQVHYETTGPEVWEQTDGAVDVFVAGIGTGGTITGVGRYLKERNPALEIVGAEDPNRRYLELHHLTEGSSYFLGFFLMGAYQDIMGDMHNLFGRVTEVHVYADADEPGNYYVEKMIPGARVEEILALVQYFPNDLARRMDKLIQQKVKAGALRPREGVELLEQYRKSFQEYTYLNPDA